MSELRPCLEPVDGLETLVSQMRKLEWTPVIDPDDLLVEDLAWIHSVVYLGSDTGGASLDSILEIQRKAANGLLRKKDIPQSKSRFFRRERADTSDSLMIAWREPSANVLEVECRLSLRTETNWTSTDDIAEPYQRGQRMRVGPASVDIMLFDPARLPDHSPPSAVIHTHFREVSN
ncbi:MAG: hypothetical protein AAF678_13850 [Pseudomonadota bacterium]